MKYSSKKLLLGLLRGLGIWSIDCAFSQTSLKDEETSKLRDINEMGGVMLCTLAVETSWVVFPGTVSLKAGASHV